MVNRLPSDVRRCLTLIRLVVLDVDGVLTDGRLVYTADGETSKVFDVRDGLGIRLLTASGVAVAVISGRGSKALERRCADLGLDADLVVQASRDKAADLDRLLARLGLEDAAVAAIGDDIPDLPVLRRAGFSACPADAVPEVVATCHYVCSAFGGRGAVRELAELILKGQGRWSEVVAGWCCGGSEPT